MLTITADIFSVESGSTIRATQLNRWILQNADVFYRAGCREGDRVVLICHDRIQSIVSLFALWRLGCSVVLLDSIATSTELKVGAQKAGAKFLIDRELKPALVAGVPLRAWPDEALVLQTSGTSARAKRVSLSHSGLQHRVKVIAQHLPVGASASVISYLPFNLAHGLIGQTLFGLTQGECLVALGGRFAMERLPELTALFHENAANPKVTFLSFVPLLARLFPAFETERSSALKAVVVASGKMEETAFANLQEWASVPIYNCFGMTETAGWCSGGVSVDSIGSGWGGARLVCEPETGELLISDDGLMLGYLDEALQRERIFSSATGRWLRTHDRCEVTEEGIRILGRLDRTVNRGGQKLNLEEIEGVLIEHPAIENVVVISRDDDLIALVVTSQVGLRPDELSRFFLERVSSWMCPNRWYFEKEIPSRPNGKPDLGAIEALIASRLKYQ